MGVGVGKKCPNRQNLTFKSSDHRAALEGKMPGHSGLSLEIGPTSTPPFYRGHGRSCHVPGPAPPHEEASGAPPRTPQGSYVPDPPGSALPL